MADTESLEQFSRKGRRVLIVIGLLLAVALIGGLWIAGAYGPLHAIAYVVAISILGGAVFPRLV